MAKIKTTNDCDVLIVGAGPTGLTFALDLARRGVNFRIVDQKQSATSQPLAFILHPKSLQILYELGVAEVLIEQGKRVSIIQGIIEKTKRFDLKFNEDGQSDFAYCLAVGQNLLEQTLIEKLKELGHEVEWKTKLTKIRQTASEVKYTLEIKGQSEEFTSKYVIGCDGKDSTVRSLLKIPFIKTSGPEHLFVADVDLEWKVQPTEGYCFIQKQGLSILIPHADGKTWRLSVPLHQPISQEINLETTHQILKKNCPVPAMIRDLKWFSMLNIQRGKAENMCLGRVYLVGDAAHVHHPIGGQGLNMGLQDANNLSWKFGMHLNGQATENILDTYALEREEVAEIYLRSTSFALGILNTQTPVLREIRNLISYAFLNFPIAKNQVKTLYTDARIRYQNSPLMNSEIITSSKYAHQLKESVINSVYVGDYAPSLVLLNPSNYKRAKLHEVIKSSSHSILVFLGEDPKLLEDSYSKFQSILKSLNGLVDGVFIVGEHAIDYNAFDPTLPDIYLDPDGLGHLTYRCWEPTIILIRPDRYVSYRGPLDGPALMKYINQHFCKPETEIKKNKTRKTG